VRQKVYPTILHSFLRIRIRLGCQSENLHARVIVLYTHNISIRLGTINVSNIINVLYCSNAKLSGAGRRAFIVAAPSVWNYLAHPALGLDSCQAQVKDIPLCTLCAQRNERIRDYCDYALYLFTYCTYTINIRHLRYIVEDKKTRIWGIELMILSRQNGQTLEASILLPGFIARQHMNVLPQPCIPGAPAAVPVTCGAFSRLQQARERQREREREHTKQCCVYQSDEPTDVTRTNFCGARRPGE